MFRLWELVFWRRCSSKNPYDTIRPESVSSIEFDKKGRVIVSRKFFTKESVVVHAEGLVREFIKGKIPKFEWVEVPQLAFAGFPSSANMKPIFSLAIAFDAAVGYFDNSGSISTFTQAQTVTGSNPILIVHPNWDAGGGQTISSVTYAGAAATHFGVDQSQGNDIDSVYIKQAPATGTNNVVVTTSGNISGSSHQMRFPILSYSGAAQTGQPDSIASTSGSGTTTQTATTTVVAANCWLVGYARNDAELVSAGTGTTGRCIASTGRGSDSNGTVAVGARSLQWTTVGNTSWCGHVESIAPVSASANSGFFMFT